MNNYSLITSSKRDYICVSTPTLDLEIDISRFHFLSRFFKFDRFIDYWGLDGEWISDDVIQDTDAITQDMMADHVLHVLSESRLKDLTPEQVEFYCESLKVTV